MKGLKEIVGIVIKRLFFSVVILMLIRAGIFLPVPGVNHSDLEFYIQRHLVTKNLVSTFSGNNTFVIGLFTLNIFPYINATIFVQLLTSLSPKVAQLQKEGDFQSRRYINQLTRIATLIWAIIQSIGVVLYLKQVLFNWSYLLGFQIFSWLTSGAMIVLWLSEIITEYGLGNGASLLIYTNLIANIPNFCRQIITENKENFNFINEIGLVFLIIGTLCAIVFLQEGSRQIPLISAKQLNQASFNLEDYYLPLRMNQAGVMPLILTTAILVIPNYIVNIGLIPQLNFLTSFKLFYWIFYFGLILVFSSFYSYIVLKPEDLNEQLQKAAVKIPSVRPGLQTMFYLKQVIKRVTLIGGSILGTIVLVPNFLESVLNISSLNGLSTASLLILAGVILDFIREIKNIYYSNIYNNRY